MSPHWSKSDAQSDLWPFLRNKKNKIKKDSGKLAIRLDHPRGRTEVKVCMPDGLRRVVLYFKFYYNRSSGFAAVGGRKSPFPITSAIGLYNSLYTTVQAVHDFRLLVTLAVSCFIREMKPDIPDRSEIAIFSYPLHSTPPLGGCHRNVAMTFGTEN